jgi:hypothetical protein
MVSFGVAENILIEFNLYEALFWIILSVSLCIAILVVKRTYVAWLYFNATNIFLFGVTDIVELYTGGFLHTTTWLLWWKMIHVCGLVVGIMWYLHIRLKAEKRLV